MKAISLRTVAFAAPLVVAIAASNGCAPEDPTLPGAAAGSAGTGTAGNGNAASGAPPATTGGMTGVSGSSAGTPPATTGGTPPTTTAGAGGASPTGTAGAGGAPGTAGSAGSGTGGAAPGDCTDSKKCIDDVLSGESSYKNPGWKDSWWVTGCSSKHAHDCYTMEACPTAGARTTETFPIGGTPGQRYKVTFQYNGVNEGRGYINGKKDQPVAADINTRTNNDSFYRDGDAPSSNYNELKLTVYDDKGVEARHYFMNGFSTAQENHLAFLSSYSKSIVIVGGGKIEHMVFDKNCHAIDNCNAGEVVGDTCNSPRRLPGMDGMLMLPPFYQNPNDGGKIVATNLVSISGSRMQPWKAQASHLTVTAIEKTTDDVKKDY